MLWPVQPFKDLVIDELEGLQFNYVEGNLPTQVDEFPKWVQGGLLVAIIEDISSVLWLSY